MTKKKGTYLPVTNVVIDRPPIQYSKDQKNKIINHFPQKSRKRAFEETINHVSILIGTLVSKMPRNIKQKNAVDDLKDLSQSLDFLEEILSRFQNNPFHGARSAFIKRFIAVQERTEKINLKEFYTLVEDARDASRAMLKENDLQGSGKENPYHFKAVQGLIDVWEKYSNKPVTIHSVAKPKPYSDDTYQKDGGPLIEYLEASINPVLKTYIKVALPYVSIANIAKDVKRAMAQKSSK